MADKRLDRFHYHEVMDRAFVLMETFGSYVMEHPATQGEAELKALAEQAHQTLFDFYQAAGRIGSERSSED